MEIRLQTLKRKQSVSLLCLSYGTENQSNWTADRRQQRLALEVVCREEGVWQTAGGRPQDSRHFEEEAGIGVRPENPDRARGNPLSYHYFHRAPRCRHRTQ